MTEYQYTEQVAAACGAYVIERARWAAVLAQPTNRAPRMARRVSLRARIIALFA